MQESPREGILRGGVGKSTLKKLKKDEKGSLKVQNMKQRSKKTEKKKARHHGGESKHVRQSSKEKISEEGSIKGTILRAFCQRGVRKVDFLNATAQNWLRGGTT